MSGSGKKRNFTLQERNLLLGILKCYKHIIENKKTDNISAKQKNDAWNNIAERYNTSAIITESASGEQLRRLWTNLKTRQREALTKERQHRLATGCGGPCPDADIDPDVAEVAPALLVEIPNIIDSDTIETETSEPVINWQITTTETPPDISAQPSTSAIENIESQSEPICFAAPPPPSVQDSDEFSSNEKKLRVQILKAEHLNREKRADELHKLTMKHLEEKHKIELEILNAQLIEARSKSGSAQTSCPY